METSSSTTWFGQCLVLFASIAATIMVRLGMLPHKLFLMLSVWRGQCQSPWVHASSRRWFNTHLCINTSLPTRNDVMWNNENNSQLIQLICTFNVRKWNSSVVRTAWWGTTKLTSCWQTILHAVREGTHRVRIFYVKTLICSFSDVLILEG